MKKYSEEKFLENLKKIVFLKNLIYTFLNDAQSDFIYRFVEAINFIVPTKRIRVKANSKSWFDNEIISVIQRRDKLCEKFNKTRN